MHVLVRGGLPGPDPSQQTSPPGHMHVLGVHTLVVAPRYPLDGVRGDLLATDLRLQRDEELPLAPGHLGEQVSEPAGHPNQDARPARGERQ